MIIHYYLYSEISACMVVSDLNKVAAFEMILPLLFDDSFQST